MTTISIWVASTSRTKTLATSQWQTEKLLSGGKKVFWRFIDICIINSWIIFHHNNPQTPIKAQRVFRLKLIEELVQQLLDLKASTNCPPYLCSRVSVSTEKRLIGKHFVYKNTKRGKCRVCSQKKNPTTGKKKDTKTQNFCQKCGIFLCIGQCFEDFHTKSSYWCTEHTYCVFSSHFLASSTCT